MEQRAQNLYVHQVLQMKREDESDCQMEDPLELGCYRPVTEGVIQDCLMPIYSPPKTSSSNDACLGDEEPQTESSRDSTISSMRVRHGGGARAYTVVNNDVGLAPTWNVRRRAGDHVSRKPHQAQALMSSKYKHIQEETRLRRDGLGSSNMEKLKRHQRDTMPDSYSKPSVQTPEHSGGGDLHISSQVSVASVDHAVLKSSPSTVQNARKAPTQVNSTPSQVQFDPVIAKAHLARWSAAEKQAIQALVCKHTLPGKKTVEDWDVLMVEYTAKGGRRKAKGLQQMVHKIDPTVKRGGTNNGGRGIKAKKAAILAKTNGGSV